MATYHFQPPHNYYSFCCSAYEKVITTTEPTEDTEGGMNYSVHLDVDELFSSS